MKNLKLDISKIISYILVPVLTLVIILNIVGMDIKDMKILIYLQMNALVR